MSDIETANEFLVGTFGRQVIMMKTPPNTLTPVQARVLAAYLVLMADVADPTGPTFAQHLTALENT